MQRSDFEELERVHKRSSSGMSGTGIATVSASRWDEVPEREKRHTFGSQCIHVVGGKDARPSVSPKVFGWSPRDLARIGVDSKQERQAHGERILPA